MFCFCFFDNINPAACPGTWVLLLTPSTASVFEELHPPIIKGHIIVLVVTEGFYVFPLLC